MSSATGTTVAGDGTSRSSIVAQSRDVYRHSAFVVWGSRRTGARSAVLAEDLGVAGGAVFLAGNDDAPRPAPWRYLAYVLRTLALLLRRRPRVVFVQSPPSYAAWLVAAYAWVSRSALVIDAHSAAFQYRAWSRPKWVHERVTRFAVATLVTDPHWATEVERAGGAALVVPDVPALYDRDATFERTERFTVAVTAAWSPDEPIGAVMDAAARMPEVEFIVTGTPRIDSAAVPENVKLAGFLPSRAYYALLACADAVMCLTTRDHTMQRGACEAVSLGRPVVTSDWPLLRSAFPEATAFADNSAAGIEAAVALVRGEHERFEREAAHLRQARIHQWSAQRALLATMIARRLRRAGA